MLPHQFPPWGTVYYYFRCWEHAGIWVLLHRAVYEQARVAAGRAACPSVVIMDGQSVKTTERGGTRGFDGHKRVKGRKRHILVDTLGDGGVLRYPSREHIAVSRRRGSQAAPSPAVSAVGNLVNRPTPIAGLR